MEVRRDPGRLEQRLAMRRYTRLALRLAEPDQRLAPLSGRDRPEQLQRVSKQLRRLARREAVQRPPPGARGVPGRLGPVDRDGRQPPVERELGELLVRVGAVEVLERLGDALVNPGAPAAAEPLIQRVVDQRVLEREPPNLTGGFAQK